MPLCCPQPPRGTRSGRPVSIARSLLARLALFVLSLGLVFGLLQVL